MTVNAQRPEGTIAIAADEPLILFSSVRAAERYLEVQDVADGVYPIAFDSEGRMVKITTYGRSVRLDYVEPPRYEAAHLLELLRQFAQWVGVSLPPNVDLGTALKLCADYEIE